MATVRTTGPGGSGPRACVFAPAPLLTVTIEAAAQRGENVGEIHLHAGGQGVWLARQLTSLGVQATLCAPFGGEVGAVLRTLVGNEDMDVRAVAPSQPNGAYVHDRRSGTRDVVATMPAGQLSRHDLDELYGITLIEALRADVTVLGGPGLDQVLPPDTYRRLAADLRSNGRTVIADLSGAPLRAALAGGLTLVKVSHEDLADDGWIPARTTTGCVIDALHELVDHGARNAVVTRAEEPALALLDGELFTATAPTLEPIDHRGAGDSLTAGLAAGLARGLTPRAALALGVAAGTLNVTRRGLATGSRSEIEEFAHMIHIEALTPGEEHGCAR